MYWSLSSVYQQETFPKQNFSNHEKCNIKLPLNTFSDQITICQISFEIFDVKQIDTRAFKLRQGISLFSSYFFVEMKKQEIFKRRHEKDQKQSFQPATLLKNRLCHRCFPVNFAKFPRTPFLTEHLQWLLLKDGKL